MDRRDRAISHRAARVVGHRPVVEDRSPVCLDERPTRASGDPLSVYTHVMQTYVEGSKVFDRDDPHDHLLAVGGYGASKDQVMHLDCFDDGDVR